MPVALDPNAKIEIILESDKGKQTPPKFLCRILTARRERKIVEILGQIKTCTVAESIDKYFEALGECLIGVDGLALPDPFDWMDVLTSAEASEIVDRVLNYNAGPDREDKKKSD